MLLQIFATEGTTEYVSLWVLIKMLLILW